MIGIIKNIRVYHDVFEHNSFTIKNDLVSLKSGGYVFNILKTNLITIPHNNILKLPFALDYKQDNYIVKSKLHDKEWESYVEHKSYNKTTYITKPFILQRENNYYLIKHNDKNIVTVNRHAINFINWKCSFVNNDMYIEL